MTAANRLAEITARADNAAALVHRYVETGGEDHEVLMADRLLQDARADVPWLVEQVRIRDTALGAVLDRHPMGKASVIEYTASGEVTHCLGCRGAHGIAHDEFGLVPWPCPTVRAIDAALGDAS